MNSHNQDTLRRVEENDDTLNMLMLDGGETSTSVDGAGVFNSRVGNYSELGAAIGGNTHLKMLMVGMSDDITLDIIHDEFYDGLKRNSSIHTLYLNCGGNNIVGGAVEEMLKAFQANNRYLTRLRINNADLQNGGVDSVVLNLRRCRNLRSISLNGCDLTGEQLMPMIDAVNGNPSLEILLLGSNRGSNRIGDDGCETIATLLLDPISNLHSLDLSGNSIGNEGATILANSLSNNTKLKNLWLHNNEIDLSVVGIFSKLLCNTSSIYKTYSSNHTLGYLGLPPELPSKLDSLLKLNDEGTNKSHVAIKKILKYHPNTDMEPLFELNKKVEGEGERNLKALPYVIAWFDRAREAVAGDEGGESYNIDERKLSALYQFARGMPLLFVPMSQ